MNEVTINNAGRYICKCESEGHIYTSEYELHIDNTEVKTPLKPKVEYADVGSNVILKCDAHGHNARYIWSRPTGTLQQSHNELTSVSLHNKFKCIYPNKNYNNNFFNFSCRTNFDYHQYKLRMLVHIFVQQHIVAKVLIFQQF